MSNSLAGTTIIRGNRNEKKVIGAGVLAASLIAIHSIHGETLFASNQVNHTGEPSSGQPVRSETATSIDTITKNEPATSASGMDTNITDETVPTSTSESDDPGSTSTESSSTDETSSTSESSTQESSESSSSSQTPQVVRVVRQNRPAHLVVKALQVQRVLVRVRSPHLAPRRTPLVNHLQKRPNPLAKEVLKVQLGQRNNRQLKIMAHIRRSRYQIKHLCQKQMPRLLYLAILLKAVC